MAEKHSEEAVWLRRTARLLPDWILPPEGGSVVGRPI